MHGTSKLFIFNVSDELLFIISSNTKANSHAYTSISSSLSLYPNGFIPNAPFPNSSELKYTTSLLSIYLCAKISSATSPCGSQMIILALFFLVFIKKCIRYFSNSDFQLQVIQVIKQCFSNSLG
ncbi:MAG: hypothetical protein DRG78_24550 [Epsilonproteobacteria bacterium]|nr:MAG: hypothetical protein DRG78_24550 [Campylobacterota bacterium]